jgi:glutamate carboxypeptidase
VSAATDVRTWLEPRADDYLTLLDTLVAADDLPRCHAALVERLGPPQGDDAGHLLYGTARGPLLSCHYDTVWAPGTAAARPLTVRDGNAYGPGTADMKGGIVVAIAALEALAVVAPEAGWRLSLTPDEEIGNRSTRDAIAELSRAATAVLVLECALPDGGVKTARKGTAEVRITVEGRGAHAGNDHADGANAVVQAAHLAVRAAALHDPAAATVCVGVLRGGERRNVVPDHAELSLDVRSFQPAAIEAVFAALRDAPVEVPGTRVTVEGEMHRPPMPRTPAIGGLYDTAAEIAAELGFALPEHAVGGGSEANLAAGAGATVLDGLGPVGAGSHALDEHVVVSSIVERAALLAGLVAALGSRP